MLENMIAFFPLSVRWLATFCVPCSSFQKNHFAFLVLHTTIRNLYTTAERQLVFMSTFWFQDQKTQVKQARCLHHWICFLLLCINKIQHQELSPVRQFCLITVSTKNLFSTTCRSLITANKSRCAWMILFCSATKMKQLLTHWHLSSYLGQYQYSLNTE